MLAVFVNMATVFAGSMIGIFFRSKIKKAFVDTMISALGLITLVIGVSSAIESEDIFCLIICIVLGTALGVLLKIEERIDRVGGYIKKRFSGGDNTKGQFAQGFASACIMFCVGSMTIMGSFSAGIDKDYDIIFAKSALDFVSSMMLSSAMGIGVVFSVLFIFLFQGGLTLFAEVISGFIGAAVITEMTAAGGTVLIGLGINMLELSERKIKVADMLPAVFLPIAYFPLSSLINSLIQ